MTPIERARYVVTRDRLDARERRKKLCTLAYIDHLDCDNYKRFGFRLAERQVTAQLAASVMSAINLRD